MAKGGKPAVQKKAKKVKFVIDCAKPIQDKIFDLNDFETFLHSKIKVAGRTGQLGDQVTIEKLKSKLAVTAVKPFSKRYVKYLTKKYLKKKDLRDWLRVIASNKNSYQLKYFQVQGDEEAEQ